MGMQEAQTSGNVNVMWLRGVVWTGNVCAGAGGNVNVGFTGVGGGVVMYEH